MLHDTVCKLDYSWCVFVCCTVLFRLMVVYRHCICIHALQCVVMCLRDRLCHVCLVQVWWVVCGVCTPKPVLVLCEINACSIWLLRGRLFLRRPATKPYRQELAFAQTHQEAVGGCTASPEETLRSQDFVYIYIYWRFFLSRHADSCLVCNLTLGTSPRLLVAEISDLAPACSLGCNLHNHGRNMQFIYHIG